MKFLPGSAVVLLTAILCAAQPTRTSETVVRARFDEFAAAFQAADAAALEKMLTEEYVHTGPTGSVSGKNQWLEWIRSRQAEMAESFYGRGPFRKAETRELMLSAHADVPAELVAAAGLPAGYGYGVFVGSVPVGDDTVRVMEQGGMIFGFSTGFWRMPDDRNLIILLDNSTSSSIREIGAAIMTALYE